MANSVTTREFDSTVSVIKEQLDEIKSSINEIKNNHLVHIHNSINEINRKYYLLFILVILIAISIMFNINLYQILNSMRFIRGL